MSAPALIAIDWGTTNRRIFAIGGDGAAIASERDGRGLLAVAAEGRGAFAADVAAIRARLGDLPLLCAGMAGSARGWSEAPYVACPAGLCELAAGIHWIEPGRTGIVPGVRTAPGARADVMRGEEVQLLGAVAAASAPPDALLCQPGTHCKWARIAGGAVADFRTAMTGELFALLRRESLLAECLDGPVVLGPAFREGLAAAADGRILGNLFGARAAVLLGSRDPAETASYVSGLLIGADVREQAMPAGAEVHLLADAELGRLYAEAIRAAGATPNILDSHAAFAAGIAAIWNLADASPRT